MNARFFAVARSEGEKGTRSGLNFGNERSGAIEHPKDRLGIQFRADCRKRLPTHRASGGDRHNRGAGGLVASSFVECKVRRAIHTVQEQPQTAQPPNPRTNNPPYGGVFLYPSDLERRIRAGRGSYGYNALGVQDFIFHPGELGRGLGVRIPYTSLSQNLPAAPTQESDVRVPSEMIAIADAFSGRNRGEKNYLFEGHYDITRIGGAGPYSRNDIQFAQTRHRGRLNVTFCDGHVEAIKVYTLFFEETDEAYKRWNRDNEPHRFP